MLAADIVVIAVGVPFLLKGDMVKRWSRCN